MAQVKIDSHVWDLICEHYAAIQAPTEADKAVQAYIVDKLNRQTAHDVYMAGKRLDALYNKTGA